MAKLAIIGYGKMGKMLEQLIRENPQHQLTWIGNNTPDITNLKEADAAIEFSVPEAAEKNILRCFEAGVPVASGTTGWTNRLPSVKEICEKGGHTFLYASNFSIGMNLFFSINQKLATLMDNQPNYDIKVEETHHLQKKDKPSGTAISLANDIIKNLKRKQKWVNIPSTMQDELVILSKRTGEVPGIHQVEYTGEDDRIELKHTALSRQGFARGAIIAANWLIGKKGFYTMKDVLNLH